jgi:hypothetical protein
MKFIMSREMKKQIAFPLFILILILSTGRIFAQTTCDQNFTVNAISTPSTCQSNGTITVTLSGNTSNLINIEYGLSAVNGDFVIAPQPSNVLSGIPAGAYNLTVRAFCSIDSNYDVVKTITNVTVGGNYQVPVATFAAGNSRKSYNDCNTGIIVLSVTRGSGTFTFNIASAPAGVSLGAVSASKSGDLYTLAGSNYPAGNYTILVSDGCYTASVQFTLGSISGYPSLGYSYSSMRPVYNSNPNCNLISWSVGGVSDTYPDYYRYYTDGMYEVSLSDGTPSTWTTWNSSSLQMNLGSHIYSDFYTDGSLKVHLRVKGCSSYQTLSSYFRKPIYHVQSATNTGCNTYTYNFTPWTDYDGMWCYPLDYVLKDNTGSTIWSSLDQAYGSKSVSGLEYGVDYTLTTTDNQGTSMVQTINYSRPNPSFTYTNSCSSYNFKYSFPTCYPLTVTLTHPVNGVVHTATVNYNSYLPTAGLNLDYNVNYTITATNTDANYSYTYTISRSFPTSYTLTYTSLDNCSENMGYLYAYTNTNNFPAGTTFTVTGPAGYTTQTYTATSASSYHTFSRTNLPAGTYTLTVNHGCGSPLTATFNFSGAYDGSALSYTSSEDCNGLSVTPSGYIKYLGNNITTYYRLTSGPTGYDKNTVLSSSSGGSFILSQAGVYKLGIMNTNNPTACVLREVSINYIPQPLQLNTEVTSAYVCNGENIGNIKIAAQNGKAPYTYQLWNAANTAKITAVQDVVTSGAAHFVYGGPGDIYTVRVTDACGNMFSQAIQLIDLSTATIVYTGNVNNTVCEGETILLRCITLGTTTYSWTGPNGFSSNQQNPIRTNASLLMAGVYSVTVTPEFCGSPLQQNITITVNSLPPLPAVSNSSLSYCQGASSPSLLSASGATASSGSTLKWYGSDGTTVITPPASINTSTPGTTTYYVSQVNAFGCEGSKLTITVTINPGQSVSSSVAISAGTTGFEVCEDAVSQIALTAIPANGGASPSYVWKVNGTQVGTGTTYTLSNLRQYRPKATVSCTMTPNVTCPVSPTVTDEKLIRISSCVIPVNPHIRGKMAN